MKDIQLIALGINYICFEIVRFVNKKRWKTIPLPGLRNVEASQSDSALESISTRCENMF